MKYITNESPLSNAELMILEIIAEGKEISGYAINRLVAARGYREWADIGQTSIYVSVKKLKAKKFIVSRLERGKTGRGPVPEMLSITKPGFAVMKHNIVLALSGRRERDRRFDLALAGLTFVKKKDIVAALKKRKGMLLDVFARLERKEESQGGSSLPLSARLLFSHSRSLIEAEAAFIDRIVEIFKEGE